MTTKSDRNSAPHIPLTPYRPTKTSTEAANEYYNRIRLRRSVRTFSDRPVPRETIEHIIASAGSAPSGANKQPWRFVAVSNPQTKHEIRVAAEAEEREFYERRASQEWLDDLKPFDTNPQKPFLEIAPWLIVAFALRQDDDGGQVYYINESVGLATGFLLSAAHHAGLATLTHTPSPMKFLAELLGRPANERPYLLIPMGYPTDDCTVPAIERKPLDQIAVFIE